jgi:hypothetical protein
LLDRLAIDGNALGPDLILIHGRRLTVGGHHFAVGHELGRGAARCMREVGANATVHTLLSAALTVISASGFSYFGVSIGPATVIGWAAS